MVTFGLYYQDETIQIEIEVYVSKSKNQNEIAEPRIVEIPSN